MIQLDPGHAPSPQPWRRWRYVARGAALLTLLAVLVRLAFIAVPASGAFARLEPQLADRCAALQIAPGTEDVTVDPDTGVAFVSTDDRRGGERGAIFAFEVEDPGTLREVSGRSVADFHPHGLSLWRGADGTRRLFVVNHPLVGDAIEIFDVAPDSGLRHVETLRYEGLDSPNDVVAVGPRQLYATNDRAYDAGLMGVLEAYLGLPLASVSYFDGERGRIVARGLMYANGINVSADGSTVYVAEILGRRIRAYRRDARSGELAPARSIAVRTAPDNIEIGADGSLWIAGHPRVFEFLAHAEAPTTIAPSQVLRVDPSTGAAESILVALGGEISAASVAAVYRGTMIVGAVFDSRVLICPQE